MDSQPITDEQRKAVAQALGYEADDEQIQKAITQHETKSNGLLLSVLAMNERKFKQAVARGVELAEEIDSIRIAIAVRSLTK